MKVKKAVITAAAVDQHTLPLQRLVDRTGTPKTVLQLIMEEVIGAGVEEVGVVIQPQDVEAYRQAAGSEAERLVFFEQTTPRGYGHALFQSREFVGGQPFLHLVGDHLYLSAREQNCAKQLVDMATSQACAVSGVQATRENRLPYFGAIGGRRVPQQAHLYEVTTVLEKPTPTVAEQDLIVGGLRAGYYLCFFGMHVLTPTIFELLAELLSGPAPSQSVTLSAALAALAKRERYLALEVDGTRYNLGMKYGLLLTQLALGLSGRDRDPLLSELLELLALTSLATPRGDERA
jgi:UTP--glucose-1-phosphate uridylyltransferase